MTLVPAALSRRRVLAALGAGLAVAACTSDDTAGPAAPAAVAPVAVVAPYVAPSPPPLPAAVQVPALVVPVAGTGEFGEAGDGGPALAAQFRGLAGVAVDMDGRIYVADAGSSRVRRIAADGRIEVFAGTGVRGESGDGGPARDAQLTDPSRMTVDGAGVLFVAELDRVRRIDPSGRISTVMGDGQPGVSGDGGAAAAARTAGNAGMAIDGEGNLFVAERAANRVRRIDTSGQVTTVAGTGVAGGGGDGGPATSAQLNEPIDVDVDGHGNLVIAELRGNRIRQIAPDGIVTTLAGTGIAGDRGDGGPAAAAEFNGPQAVAVDGGGNVLVADWNNRRIRRIRPDGVVDSIAGSAGGRTDSGGPAIETRLVLPVDLAPTPDGSLLFIEQGTRQLRALRAATSAAPAVPAVTRAATAYIAPDFALPLPAPVPDGAVAVGLAGTGQSGYGGDGGPAADAQFASARGIAIDAAGRIFIADTGNHRIRRLELDGTVRTVAGTGTPGFSGDGGQATDAELSRPTAVVVDRAGALYVADAGNFRVRRVGVDGIIVTLTGGPQPGTTGDGGPARDALFTEPSGLALDTRGRLFVADAPAHRVRVIELDGTVRLFAGRGVAGADGDGGPAIEAAIGFPQRIVVDSRGALFVAQIQAGLVRRIDPDGVVATVVVAAASGDPPATAQFDAPIGLAADSVGNLYVVESGAGAITRISPDGIRSVVAGDPTGQGRSGDPATDVPLFTAVDLALGSAGEAYVLEARGLVWRIGPRRGDSTADGADAGNAATPAVSPSAIGTPTVPPSADEFAEIESITLALRLDAGQRAIDPTLEFHPGERVNVSVVFANVREGSRLGIRWSAGDRALGTFLTDPQPAYGRATFGFFFSLGPAAAVGPWTVKILVGTHVAGTASFAVAPGEIRVTPAQG